MDNINNSNKVDIYINNYTDDENGNDSIDKKNNDFDDKDISYNCNSRNNDNNEISTIRDQITDNTIRSNFINKDTNNKEPSTVGDMIIANNVSSDNSSNSNSTTTGNYEIINRRDRISCPFLIRGKHDTIIDIRDEKYRHENYDILIDKEGAEGKYI